MIRESLQSSANVMIKAAGMLMLLFSWLSAPAVLAADHSSRQLQSIEAQALPGDEVELEFKLSGPAPEPMSFTIDSPARISMDLSDTSLALASRRTNVGMGAVGSVVAAEANGRTRVVVNLSSMVPYETRVVGSSVFVRVGSNASAGSQVAFSGGTQASRPATSSRVAAAGRSISDIDFRRGEDGAGRLLITLTDPGTVIDLREQGDQIIVELADINLPKELMRRMDVVDFATPVTTVDAISVGGNARLIINASGDYEQMAYQSDNLFSVEIREKAAKKESIDPFGQDKTYVGDRLTLNFQDIEVRAVLQLLADMSGLNIVVSDTVQGNVTLRLHNVPWDQALDIVMQTKGLDMRRNENVVIVAPADELAARERAALENLKDMDELIPLRSEFIQVNYAKATDIAELIRGGEGGALLSDRGSIAVDERTNTLLAQDTSERLMEIRRLVEVLDIPVKQVLIESRIVIVSDDFSRELGAQLGLTRYDRDSSNRLWTTSGSSAATDTMIASELDNRAGGGGGPIEIPVGDSRFDRYNVNLPPSTRGGSIALSVLGSNTLLDLELSAAQAEDRAEIISTPRLITANQKEARIKAGVEIPYQEGASSGATTTRFKEAVLSLQVTPLITPDDRVVMDLVVSKDNVGENVQSATGGLVPSIDTREIATQVL
ncbi:MAG: type IV pilus secretin PilQ, partial [Chromatiales bacterium]|nr:type IV pilus secretin PilQ [Chromatiales bacterium]